MADRYRAVLAMVAGPGLPPWGELTRSVLPTVFRASGLVWGQAEHVRSGGDLLIVLPAEAVGRLTGGFVQELADAMAGRPEPMRLGLGLAIGMCHSDGKGWYGDVVTKARALAAAPPAEGDCDVRLAAGDAVRELRATYDDRTEMVLTATGSRSEPGPRPGIDTPGSVAEPPDIAAVIEAVAAPVAAFAEELPVLLSADVAPSDVLAWMYRALGVDSPRLLDDRNGRRLLTGLMRCYRMRGTARGLAELIELRYGVEAEVVDPGRTTWFPVPETPVRRPPAPVIVLIDSDEPLGGLDEVIRSALPVGVGYRVSRRPRRAGGLVR
jgi:phage tail-like protein